MERTQPLSPSLSPQYRGEGGWLSQSAGLLAPARQNFSGNPGKNPPPGWNNEHSDPYRAAERAFAARGETRGDTCLEASEEELVRAAAGGDDGAFHALVDRHAPAMFRVAQGLTRNRADAEDLVQETLVGAYRGLKHFAGRSSVKTWLLQILTRQAAKAWHRNRHARRTLSLTGGGSDDDDGRASAATVAEDAAVGRVGDVGGKEGPVAAVEKRLDVMDVLRRLSPPHREILVLREMRQLSYEEIAEVLGVPRGTVESRLSRARAEFRQRYETPDPPPAATCVGESSATGGRGGGGGAGGKGDGGRAG